LKKHCHAGKRDFLFIEKAKLFHVSGEAQHITAKNVTKTFINFSDATVGYARLVESVTRISGH